MHTHTSTFIHLYVYVFIIVGIWSDLLGNIFSWTSTLPICYINTFEMGDYLKSGKVLDKPSLSSEEM